MEKEKSEKMAVRPIPRAGEIYRHFKNKMYQIVAVASHTETGEQLVVYEALYDDFKIYARPLSMFLSEVDHAKYPNAAQKYRFELIEREVDGTLKMGYPVKLQEIFGQPKEETEHSCTEQTEEEPQAAALEIVKEESVLNAESTASAATENDMQKEEKKVSIIADIESASEEGYLDDEEINPFLLQFLDTDSYGEKLEVLISIRSRLDDRLIDDMAAALDVTVDDGPLPVRYEGLKTCLETMVKFECERFR